MSLLTKTDFILYRECPNCVWVKRNNPEIYAGFEVSEFEKSLAVLGNEVEELARGMFPTGYLVERRDEVAQELTKKLISQRVPIIFQAVFANDKFITATDVLKWNDTAQKYDIYEIKMSSTTDEDDEDEEEGKPRRVNKKKELQYEYDLAFQVNVVESCGIPLNEKYLIRLNRDYTRNGELDFAPNKLFIIENKTESIETLKTTASIEMSQSQDYLSSNKMPEGPCPCYYRGRNSHCTAFNFLNPNVPAYSVHDLNRIGSSPKLLRKLLDSNILEISKVPEDLEGLIPKPTKDRPNPKPRKLNQIKVHKSLEPLVDVDAIKSELDKMIFPLYFLDYETYPTAIPPYDGYHPYQQIVFQYSLHVLENKDSLPLSFECLILDGEPSKRIAENLRKHIGNSGTVISWYKKFENSRNRELAGMLPEYKDFFTNIISRTYDLMDIVENQHYVHPGFLGRSSIKNVLPAIAELTGREVELSYKKLGVRNGMEAIEAYRQITKGELVGEEAKEKEQQMIEYCRLDTYAMYVLWKFFNDLVSTEIKNSKNDINVDATNLR